MAGGIPVVIIPEAWEKKFAKIGVNKENLQRIFLDLMAAESPEKLAVIRSVIQPLSDDEAGAAPASLAPDWYFWSTLYTLLALRGGHTFYVFAQAMRVSNEEALNLDLSRCFDCQVQYTFGLPPLLAAFANLVVNIPPEWSEILHKGLSTPPADAVLQKAYAFLTRYPLSSLKSRKTQQAYRKARAELDTGVAAIVNCLNLLAHIYQTLMAPWKNAFWNGTEPKIWLRFAVSSALYYHASYPVPLKSTEGINESKSEASTLTAFPKRLDQLWQNDIFKTKVRDAFELPVTHFYRLLYELNPQDAFWVIGSFPSGIFNNARWFEPGDKEYKNCDNFILTYQHSLCGTWAVKSSNNRFVPTVLRTRYNNYTNYHQIPRNQAAAEDLCLVLSQVQIYAELHEKLPALSNLIQRMDLPLSAYLQENGLQVSPEAYSTLCKEFKPHQQFRVFVEAVLAFSTDDFYKPFLLDLFQGIFGNLALSEKISQAQSDSEVCKSLFDVIIAKVKYLSASGEPASSSESDDLPIAPWLILTVCLAYANIEQTELEKLLAHLPEKVTDKNLLAMRRALEALVQDHSSSVGHLLAKNVEAATALRQTIMQKIRFPNAQGRVGGDALSAPHPYDENIWGYLVQAGSVATFLKLVSTSISECVTLANREMVLTALNFYQNPQSQHDILLFRWLYKKVEQKAESKEDSDEEAQLLYALEDYYNLHVVKGHVPDFNNLWQAFSTMLALNVPPPTVPVRRVSDADRGEIHGSRPRTLSIAEERRPAPLTPAASHFRELRHRGDVKSALDRLYVALSCLKNSRMAENVVWACAQMPLWHCTETTRYGVQLDGVATRLGKVERGVSETFYRFLEKLIDLDAYRELSIRPIKGFFTADNWSVPLPPFKAITSPKEWQQGMQKLRNLAAVNSPPAPAAAPPRHKTVATYLAPTVDNAAAGAADSVLPPLPPSPSTANQFAFFVRGVDPNFSVSAAGATGAAGGSSVSAQRTESIEEPFK